MSASGTAAEGSAPRRGSTRPEIGSQRSQSPKTMIRINPSQKVGIETPSKTTSRAEVIENRMPPHRGQRAEDTPATTAIAMAAMASSIVAGNRAAISAMTGVLERYERPKSPRTAPERNARYCTSSGRSSPSSCLRAAIDSGSARAPRMVCAGSPPAECSIRKTSSDTPSRMGIVSASRRSRYRVIRG